MTMLELENNLIGLFWTAETEMIEELEELGYEVLEVKGEYISMLTEEDDEDGKEFLAYLGHANSTMWIEKIREI